MSPRSLEHRAAPVQSVHPCTMAPLKGAAKAKAVAKAEAAAAGIPAVEPKPTARRSRKLAEPVPDEVNIVSLFKKPRQQVCN